MSATKVAIVSGSNKGIGFAIVRGLCKQFSGDVYLTSRDVGRGETAVRKLQEEGLNPKFHQLDINDKASIEKLRDFILSQYGGIDVLVNNAAISFTKEDPTPLGQQAAVSMRTNYTALIDVCDILFPLLIPGARVVHVAGTSGTEAFKKLSVARKTEALAIDTIGELTKFMDAFVKDAKAGNHTSSGWPSLAYGMTKIGVIMATTIQQKAMAKDRRDIAINCCCPGLVITDMSSHKGLLTIDQGAETPLYLALLPQNEGSPKGCLVKDKKVIVWRKS